MESGETVSDHDGAVVLDRWSARKVRPIILLYVIAVFAAFMVVAHLVFDSQEAVKALAFAALGAVAATTPGVLEKVEYRLTESGLDKRTLKTNNPGPFKDVFRSNELDHIVPMKHGFKYYKTLSEPNPLRRFWKAHMSDRYSGEVHVERNDVDRIVGIVERQRAATPMPD